MGLPLHTRAAALAAALSTTAAIIVTMAEIGHPPPDGTGMLALFHAPEGPPPGRVAQADGHAAKVPVAVEMPQP
jgi:hypothetical protein